MQLSKTEKQLMQYLWKLDKAYMKDLLDSFFQNLSLIKQL